MLDDKIAEMLTKYVDEESYHILERVVENYGRRGAIFVGMPSGNMMFATRKELRAMGSIHNQDDNLKLLLHLVDRYKLYNEALLVFVWEDSKELIKIAKIEVDYKKVGVSHE